MKMRLLLPLILAHLLSSCQGGPEAGAPEIGTITYLRDYDEAAAKSKETGKPIFALFQEVPGCSGCRQFGQDVLSDPEMVKTIEKEFIPLLIKNNQPGKDAQLLRRFKEPAWNYQVVRFFDHSGKDIIPRKDRVWDKESLKKRIQATLKKANRKAE